MKNEEVRNRLPYNLQLFATSADKDGEGEDDIAEENNNEVEETEGKDGGEEKPDEEEKTLTQSEMNAIATKEKKQGKKAMLKELGFKNESDAKKEIEAFRQWKESQMTDEEKAQRDAKEKDAAQQALLDRALKAEQKLAALSAGIRPDSIDDAIAIANLKVTEEKDLDEVLGDMKKETRYASFFNKDPEDESKGAGTGSSTKHSKEKKKVENIGERLGKQRATAITKKSSFFKN